VERRRGVKFRILLARNILEDAGEKAVSIKMPNGDVIIITEYGDLIKVTRDGVYKPRWERIQADPAFYKPLFPEEEVEKDRAKIRRGDKLIAKTGPLEIELGQLVEY
jgi:hypothetical protein